MAHANFLTDNPAVYEAWFPDSGHVAARFTDDLVRRFGGGTDLLDVGCGTGRDARWWCEHGYQVTGLDSSPAMISHATEHCPQAEFLVGDMRSFALRHEFDVITCLDSALLYCHENSELEAFLTSCHDHLRPGGLFIAEARNGAFFLGNTELLDEVLDRTLSYDGVDYRSMTRLWIDHAEQLLRRERRWRWPGAEELVQRSAWRLLFPQELRYFAECHGFEVLALFDEPGPRTDTPWSADAELSERMSGDRLHLIARRID
ncbi:hypothetical protein GCM10009854_48650 [Saccharopolyspora halophila]|uniref:Methyltransferase domain-containing protein n=1 Tax=Saccharopolyspora halophila TaxID=405551 RepID=A0ABN3GX34_9PSEU